MYIIKRKYIFLCLLFGTLATDIIYASGFEVQISQAGQAIGSAVIASVATAVAIATKIIRPVDPEKDLPQPKIQEKPELAPQQSIPQEIAPSQSQSSPAASKAIAKPEDFQTPTWQPASQKKISQEPVQISILIQPAPEIPQPEIPAASSISTTQAALMAAQKLQSQKQTAKTQTIDSKESVPEKIAQHNIPVPQKQISHRASQSAQQTPVSCEWNELEEFDEVKEEPIYSFTQLYTQKRSNNYADKLLYERSVHFYFERIENSSLLKPEQVMQETYYAIKNMELVIENKENGFNVIYNIPEYLHAAKNASKMLTFIGYTTNNNPIWIVLNPYLKAFITFYPILGK